jgi:hypothetical protein
MPHQLAFAICGEVTLFTFEFVACLIEFSFQSFDETRILRGKVSVPIKADMAKVADRRIKTHQEIRRADECHSYLLLKKEGKARRLCPLWDYGS